MRVLLYVSDAIIPIFIVVILCHGLLRKENVYEDFLEGAKDGFQTVISILPTLIGLMCGVGVLRASGLLTDLAEFLGKIMPEQVFPSVLLPAALVKMFSSSAATGLILDIFKEYGPDSLYGKTASLMGSCTETIFYTMSVYFMSVKVNKTRWTLPGALFSTIVGIAASVVLAKYI